MPGSTYSRDQRLNHTYRGQQAPLPPGTWAALYNGDPRNGGTELSGNGYARVRIYGDDVTEPYWTPPADHTVGRKLSNAQEVAFPAAAGGAWNQADWWATVDAAAGAANILDTDVIRDGAGTPTPRTASIGDVLRFQPGTFVIYTD